MGNVLSPEQREELTQRLRVRQDHILYRFDGKLVDALKTFVPKDVMSVVLESLKDERCSKQTFIREAGMDAFREFLSPERRDARGTKPLRAARVLLEKMLPNANLVPADFNKMSVKLFSNQNGAAGAIAQGTKADQEAVCLLTANTIVNLVQNGVPFSKIFVPTMAYKRSQLGNLVDDSGHYSWNPKLKFRAVEGVDGGTGLVEASYGNPIYSLFKESWESYVGGKDPEQMRWLIRRARFERSWLSTDFSKFDQHVPGWLIHVCFDVLKRKYFEQSEWLLFEWVAHNFINTTMITFDNTIITKHKGIPSGSYFTQIIGTMANILMNLAAKCYLTGLNSVNQMVSRVESEIRDPEGHWLLFAMGDDYLEFSSEPINRDEHVIARARYIEETFGVSVQPEKCDRGYTTTYPKFLKREWRGGGEYSEPKAHLINLVHNEYDRLYDTYSPWHIIYGMYVTYRETYKSWISEYDLVEKMRQSTGGLRAILDLRSSELPGVLRGLGESGVELLYRRTLKLAG
jgi:hypothetical protein